jgi:hypothetical protein
MELETNSGSQSTSTSAAATETGSEDAFVRHKVRHYTGYIS